MSGVSIGPSPSQRPLSDERSWVQWLSSLGMGLGGRWGRQEDRKLEFLGCPQPTKQKLYYRGRAIDFLIEWEAQAQTWSGASIVLAKDDLTIEKGFLQVWEGSNLVGGALAEGKTISLPSLTLTEAVILQGSVLTQIESRRA